MKLLITVLLCLGMTAPALAIDGWKTTEVTATAYVVRSDPHGGCLTYTNGTALSGSQANLGTIAVDPRVFPKGTRFIIPGYGHGIADDRGGAIVGHILDLAMYSCRSAFQWGVRHITVKYKLPR